MVLTVVRVRAVGCVGGVVEHEVAVSGPPEATCSSPAEPPVMLHPHPPTPAAPWAAQSHLIAIWGVEVVVVVVVVEHGWGGEITKHRQTNQPTLWIP